MKKVCFYLYEPYEGGPDLEELQVVMDAVYNGKTVPRLVDVPQDVLGDIALAVCSEPVEPEIARRLFMETVKVEYNAGGGWWWRDPNGVIVTYDLE